MSDGIRGELEEVIQEMDMLSYSRGQTSVSYDDVTGWASVMKGYRQWAEANIAGLERQIFILTRPCPLPDSRRHREPR